MLRKDHDLTQIYQDMDMAAVPESFPPFAAEHNPVSAQAE
jgi:hypothetical protein